jgi:hypothetical protein
MEHKVKCRSLMILESNRYMLSTLNVSLVLLIPQIIPLRLCMHIFLFKVQYQLIPMQFPCLTDRSGGPDQVRSSEFNFFRKKTK